MRSSKAHKFASVKYHYLSIVCFLFASVTYSQTGTGYFGFSNVPISATSAGLGGTNLSSYGDDVNQVTHNPALLDSSTIGAVSLSYLNYLTDINQASVAYAHLLDSIGIVSGYLRFMDYGEFVETDEFGNELASFRSSEYELGVSLTRFYSKRISYGVTFKNYVSALYSNVAYGAAFDIGGY